MSILRNAHFDAALLNINKPGILGADVCRGIRKDLPRLPILILGVVKDEDQEVEAFEAGAKVTKKVRHATRQQDHNGT